MSPMDAHNTSNESVNTAVLLPASAGQWLRQARERAGLDMGVLSALIKVPVRQLEALEADQHDQLMGTAFVRSLTRTVCRHLHVDPQPALDLLPRNDTRLGPEKDTLGEADAPPLGGLFHGRTPRAGKLLFVLLLLALVGGGLYWKWHSTSQVALPEPAPITLQSPTVVESSGVATESPHAPLPAATVTEPVNPSQPLTPATDSKAQ